MAGAHKSEQGFVHTPEFSRLVSIYGELEAIFKGARPPITQPKPDNAWTRFQADGKHMSGVEMLEGDSSRERLEITARVESLGERLVGRVIRIDYAAQGETYVLGYGFGRAESREKEQIPQRPLDPRLEYAPQPARTRGLTAVDIDFLESTASEASILPSRLTYSFEPVEDSTQDL